MKEYNYYYKCEDGRLKHSMSAELFLLILCIFWALPIIAMVQYVWHIIKGNSMLIPIKDYHAYNYNYFKKTVSNIKV